MTNPHQPSASQPAESAGGESGRPSRWYDGVTAYHWLVLAIASAGWIFDVFEGQLFVIYKTPAMTELLGVTADHPQVAQFAEYALASFMVGGALGGLVFGILADRIGRRRSMVYSILMYSIFTGLHYFATNAWHVVGLRFFVAMGVGGEWAIAAALVSEVFPKHARAVAGGIFHASSVLGAVLAARCGMFLTGSDWRIAFLVGLVPAVLILWIRSSLKESERWEATRLAPVENGGGSAGGSVIELLSDRRWAGRAMLGLGLASIGMGTYWGVYAWGPELATDVLKQEARTLTGSALQQRVEDVLNNVRTTKLDGGPMETVILSVSEKAGLDELGNVIDPAQPLSDARRKEQETARDQLTLLRDTRELIVSASGGSSLAASLPDATGNAALTLKYREILTSGLASGLYSYKSNYVYEVMNLTGGFLGLLLFAPLASTIGRRSAFVVYHVGALIMAPLTFYIASGYGQTMALLSVMAFFVVGMHAGYAIYFPELFPTRLRATGASFCFNVGRLLSAAVLLGRVHVRQYFADTYDPSLGLRYAVASLALLFVVGLVLLIFAPETRNTELAD